MGAEITACTGRELAPGALYTTLDRLESKGMVSSRLGDPIPQRGDERSAISRSTGRTNQGDGLRPLVPSVASALLHKDPENFRMTASCAERWRH